MVRDLVIISALLAGTGCSTQSPISCDDIIYATEPVGATVGCKCENVSGVPGAVTRFNTCTKTPQAPLCCATPDFETTGGGSCRCWKGMGCSTVGGRCTCTESAVSDGGVCPKSLPTCCYTSYDDQCVCSNDSSCTYGTRVSSCPVVTACSAPETPVNSCSPPLDEWL